MDQPVPANILYFYSHDSIGEKAALTLLTSVVYTHPVSTRYIASTALQQSVIRHLLYFYAIVSKILAYYSICIVLYILMVDGYGCSWPGLLFFYLPIHFSYTHKLFACIDPFSPKKKIGGPDALRTIWLGFALKNHHDC